MTTRYPHCDLMTAQSVGELSKLPDFAPEAVAALARKPFEPAPTKIESTDLNPSHLHPRDIKRAERERLHGILTEHGIYPRYLFAVYPLETLRLAVFIVLHRPKCDPLAPFEIWEAERGGKTLRPA